jgi:hypothetical protein
VRTGQRSSAAGAPARMAPLKLAIIGGGPSSFYVASRLLSLFPKDEPRASQLKIHIYDRLWAPHGLVRYGVAPDHPEVKVRFLPPHVTSFLQSAVLFHTRTARTSLTRLQRTLACASLATSRSGFRRHRRFHTHFQYPSPL